ncbi:MAG: hypothetical protein F6K31_07170, partial [Symploca sp. SIO2G7]|nr:hypothetical protein [Symploca sp. SIO2G7]
ERHAKKVPGGTNGSGFGIKFSRRTRRIPRPITSRRLSAAERALKRQRDKYPLLSDWVAESQPTAEERLEHFQEVDIEREKSYRQWDARKWKQARAWLRTLPRQERLQLIHEWNQTRCPHTAAYFADFISQHIPAAKEEARRKLAAMVEAHREQKLQALGFYRGKAE